MQCTVHVEPPAQFTLPLGPTVTSQSDCPAQLTLHDSPHVPVHVLPFVHASEQLDPEQPELPMSQDVCAGHEHDVPLHVGGGAVLLPPHPIRKTMKTNLITPTVREPSGACLCTCFALGRCRGRVPT